MYEITRDGWISLVMGFEGKKANLVKIKYIEAFNAMEQPLFASCDQNSQKNLPTQKPTMPFLICIGYEEYAFKETIRNIVREFLSEDRKKQNHFDERAPEEYWLWLFRARHGIDVMNCAYFYLKKSMMILSQRQENLPTWLWTPNHSHHPPFSVCAFIACTGMGLIEKQAV